ncbi:MAG: hypothetical protein ACAH21_13690 [Ramlibacter sp.]|nr:hypothetical protein [Ramlibacter sp.]
MRAIFGVLGLLVVVAIIGVLAKKQLGSVTAPPAATAASGGTMAAPSGTPQQQVQQFQQSVQGTMQQARPADDTK